MQYKSLCSESYLFYCDCMALKRPMLRRMVRVADRLQAAAEGVMVDRVADHLHHRPRHVQDLTEDQADVLQDRMGRQHVLLMDHMGKAIHRRRTVIQKVSCARQEKAKLSPVRRLKESVSRLRRNVRQCSSIMHLNVILLQRCAHHRSLQFRHRLSLRTCLLPL